LYFSNPDAALKIPVTLRSGYGIVEMGTLLSEVLLATVSTGYYVPYNPTTYTGDVAPFARAFVVADTGSASVCYITQEDSWKFAVGDSLTIESSGQSAKDLSFITAIDRTTERQRAKITFTTGTGADYTTAHSAYITLMAGAIGNYWSDAIGVLEKDVDTGTGTDAKGANATLIIKNAILYTGALANIDAASITDLSATAVSRFIVL